MPTYSYRCTECGRAFDIHQAFTDDSLTVCPNCSGVLRKIFSPVGITFTGSGFYSNDSRSKSSSTDAAKPASTPSTPAPSSTTSAPASKPASSPTTP